jgi:hypothetical protein
MAVNHIAVQSYWLSRYLNPSAGSGSLLMRGVVGYQRVRNGESRLGRMPSFARHGDVNISAELIGVLALELAGLRQLART